MFEASTFAATRAGATLLHVAEPKRDSRWPHNPARLWETVGPILDRDSTSLKLGAEIRKREEVLRREVTALAWRKYVALEEATAHRSLRWLEVVAVFAYSKGVRRRRRSG